jgi:mono/diheme cytochrome c family protein
VVGSLDADGNEIGRLELGGEPTRIARLGDSLLVSQRTERSLAVLSEADGGLVLDQQITVGAEPVGVVAAEDGSFAYAAASLSGTVVEIDGSTMALSRSWAVPGEPRWLALHPSGSALFVGCATGTDLFRIDLSTEEVRAIPFPEVRAQAFADGTEFAMTPRATGDLAVSPNGKALAVPVLYVDNTTPVPPPDGDGAFDDELVGGGDGYAANGGTRFTGGVVLMDLDAGGELTGGDPTVLSLNGFLPNADFATVGGYPASVAWDTDNRHVFAAMEGAGAVLRVQAYQSTRFNNGGGMEPDIAVPVPMDDVGFDGEFGATTGAFVLGGQLESHATDTIATAGGPRGLAMLDWDQVFVHGFLDRAVQKLPVDALPSRNEFGETDEQTGGVGALARTTDVFVEFGGFEAGPATEFAPDVLSPEVRAGRELFMSSTDSRMSSGSAPISCGTCHFDGRADGLTWTFQDGDGVVKLQTPSLAGDVSATAPVTWLSSVPTVADEAMITSQGRMGGSGLQTSEADLVAAYIDWSRAPDSPLAGVDSDAVRRGEVLFQSEEVGCADCHSGAALSDNEEYDMYGLQGVRTRSLVGIAASAPYLHDGSAQTLTGLMRRSRDGSMGDTSSLSDAQIEDLVAYLSSL